MGVSDVDIDRMLGFRGGWKMARQRTLSEVFDPPPAITDGERLSDLLGIVALDGGVDPSSLVGSLQGIKVGDLDKPGQKLFDKLWGQFTPTPDIKATDARSAFAGKGDPNKRAILQEWASLNPKLAESLGTLMTFEWTDPRKPRQPTEVGVINVGEVHPTDWGGAEFVLHLAGIPDEATFNTFLRRLSGVGAAPAAPSFEGDGFGSVIVRVANADQAAQLREGLDAYRARGVPESPVVVGRQFSPFEVYPRLFS